ncbi:MAG TPA: hemerythrin domain-containing protein [Thermoanaerobaculia bacterium]|jgi:hemerythrin superfamily protein
MANVKKNSKAKGGESEGILSKLGTLIKGDEGPRADEPEDATELLKKDHDKVRDLFKRYEASDRAAEKAQIARTVCAELTVHAEIEEEIFYPALERAGQRDSVKMVRESVEEHKIVKTLVGELEGMTPRDPQFEAKFTVLREAVEHHADEEEDDLFPDAKRDLGENRLRELGGQMQARKQELAEPGAQKKDQKPPARSARPGAARRGRPAGRGSSGRARA